MISPIPSRPCWVEIDTRALEENFRFLRDIAPPQAELLAIVKADAYGHSIAACAPAAVSAGARWLGVTTVDEAIAARRLCPHTRFLIMGGVFSGQGSWLIQHSLTAAVWQTDQLDEIETAARAASAAPQSVPIHLEIDTGMTRQGALPETLPALLQRFSPQSPLRLEAVMTHLYASDDSTGFSTAAQFARLDEAMRIVSAAGHAPEWLSVGASAALLGPEAALIAAMAARWGVKPMLRPGLALYGVVPRFGPPFTAADEPIQLSRAARQVKPVLAWKTRVETLRDISPGTQVGYNGTFVATEPMRVALLPAGYADGLDRRLGNRFHLLVRGRRAPLIGRISMDQSVLDVTEIAEVRSGDEVVILGSQGDESVSAYDHADACATIPWEIFTRISNRVPRVIV